MFDSGLDQIDFSLVLLIFKAATKNANFSLYLQETNDTCPSAFCRSALYFRATFYIYPW